MSAAKARLVCALLPALGAACTTGKTQSVSERLTVQHSSARPPDPASSAPVVASDPQVIASVNDRPILADQFRRLLAESHGLFVLEQLIALELVREHGRSQGINLSASEIDAEYDHSLREMARAAGAETGALDLLAAGREMLEQFLAARNISVAEYRLSIERNALLRKMVAEQPSVTDDEVSAEFERRHGRQAIVRHIVLPDLMTVGEVRARLEAGDDFPDVARAYSVHRLSGAAGGLLPSFTQGDPQIPALLRDAAFALQPGQVSDALAIDGQYHLIRVEQFVETPHQAPDASMVEDLRVGLADAKLRTQMDRLERSLFKQAQIRILDPDLQDRFRRKHAGND